MNKIIEIIKESRNQQVIPESLNERLIDRKHKSILQNGHDLVDEIHRLLTLVDEKVWPRSMNQLNFCESMLKTCSCLIYRGVFEDEKKAILERNKWTECKYGFALEAPRREGKSEMVSAFVACLMYLIDKLNVLIIIPESAMGNKNTGLIGGIIRYLDNLLGVKVETLTNKGQKFVKFIRNGTERTIRCESRK